MQIREQGKKIQLIRTHYNKEKKRTEGKVFDSFNIYLSTIPECIRLQLNKEEVCQLESYLSNREEKFNSDNLKNSLFGVKGIMLDAAKALELDGINDLVERYNEAHKFNVADDIYAAMSVLTKALKKAGYKKTAKDAPITVIVNPENQATLFDPEEEYIATINTK